jgi:hypothetical protein
MIKSSLRSKRKLDNKDFDARLWYSVDTSLTPQYQTSVDADGNITGHTHITTNTDANGNSYTSTNHYDAQWTVTESAYSDSLGNSSVTQYQTSVDADGNITGYTHITTNTDANGNSYTSTNHYDAQWTVTESAYSDSLGNSRVTQYQTNVDADGNITGYTHITTNTDANGNSYTATNHYDAQWTVTDSAYSDSLGNSSVTQYQTSIDIDVDGNFQVCICFDLSDQCSEKLISEEGRYPEISTASSIVSESDFIASSDTLSPASNDLFENADDTFANLDLVGIANLVHTDFIVV